jgi:hypothetical protein
VSFFFRGWQKLYQSTTNYIKGGLIHKDFYGFDKNTTIFFGDLTNKLNYINLLGLLYLLNHTFILKHHTKPWFFWDEFWDFTLENGHRSMFFIGKLKINHRKNHGKTMGFGVALYFYPLFFGLN